MIPGLVSIVITTFNRAHMLEDCIRILSGQTYTQYEVVIIDDGSSDNTKEVVERLLPTRRSSSATGCVATTATLELCSGEQRCLQPMDFSMKRSPGRGMMTASSPSGWLHSAVGLAIARTAGPITRIMEPRATVWYGLQAPLPCNSPITPMLLWRRHSHKRVFWKKTK